jgi:hypothetical protein
MQSSQLTKLKTNTALKAFLLTCVLATIFFYFSLFFSVKINTSNSDIGRHLINGLNVLGGNFNVLYSDFYTYTLPNTSHVNHHYLSGVFYYLVFQKLGFIGLSVTYSLLGAIFVFSLFYYGYKKVGLTFSLLIVLIFLPFFSQRTEVRPEIFSYILLALTAILLTEKRKKLNFSHYIVIFVLQALAINLHNYALFSFVVTIGFLIEAFISKDLVMFKKLFLFLIVQLIATFFTPHGYKVFLVPFEPLFGIGVQISENTSLFDKNFQLTFAVLGFILALIQILVQKRFNKIGLSINVILFAVLSFYMGRILSLYSIVFFVFLISLFETVPQKYLTKVEKKLKFALPLLMFLFLAIPLNKNFGYGLVAGVENGGRFFVEKNIPGPVFNDYNAGGYLIYHTSILEPLSKQGKKVYIHNVPESLPVDFVKNWYEAYINGEFPTNADEKYNFQSILVSTHLKDPTFLIKKITEPDWKLVFYDGFVAIFVRNNEKNADLIDRYEVAPDIREYILRKEVDTYSECELADFKTIKNVCSDCSDLCITPWGAQYFKEISK